MPFGAELRGDGWVRFRLWAPAVEWVRLELCDHGRSLPMKSVGGGWHELVAEAAAGERYRFVLPDGTRGGRSGLARPGRRCRRSFAHRRPWRLFLALRYLGGTALARGRDLRAACRHLHARRHLRRVPSSACPTSRNSGVTAIELMPVADFVGRRNWGYDGVLPVRPGSGLWHARGAEGVRRRGARAWADGSARCRRQSFRPGRQSAAPLCAGILHRRIRYSVGPGDQLRRARRARVLYPQCALLARGVSARRAAVRCRACHLRPQRSALHGRAGASRPSGGAARRSSDRRERAKSSRTAATRIRYSAAGYSRRSGTTICITRCT